MLTNRKTCKNSGMARHTEEVYTLSSKNDITIGGVKIAIENSTLF
jgi:hypothetical protein